MLKATCSVDACDRSDRMTRGLCSMHYQRLYHTGTTDAKPKPPRKPKPSKALPRREKPAHCTTDDCTAPIYARRWCTSHYDYHWRYEQRVAEAAKRGKKLRRLEDPGLKTCPRCEGQFPLTYYPPSKQHNQLWVCHPCAMVRLSAERAADPERFSTYTRKAYRRNDSRYLVHGITAQRAAEMVAEQGGCCPICTDPIDLANTRQTAIDHDHACCPGRTSCGDCVRRILCRSCNTFVGLLELRPERVERALLYVKGELLPCTDPTPPR